MGNTISGKTNVNDNKQEFLEKCLCYDKQLSNFDESPNKDYQQYLNCYPQFASHYLINYDDNSNRTMLIVYDLESKTEKETVLKTPEPLNHGTFITQLPNGELFCYGSFLGSTGITLIIDRKYRVKILPSGTCCNSSSCIYRHFFIIAL